MKSNLKPCSNDPVNRCIKAFHSMISKRENLEFELIYLYSLDEILTSWAHWIYK